MNSSSSFSLTIVDIYKEILEGKRKSFPMYTWTPENEGYVSFRRCMHYLVYDKLELDRESILRIDGPFFRKYKLRGAMSLLFSDKTFEALRYAFPEENILMWEVKQVPTGTWTQENSIRAIRWAIVKFIGKNREDILENVTHSFFKDKGLAGALLCFESMYEVLHESFPELKFTPEEIKFRKGKEVRVSVIKKLLEIDLGWSLEEIEKNISWGTFHDNGLGSFFLTYYQGSVYRALEEAYPEVNWRSKINKFKRKARPKHSGTGNHLSKFSNIEVEQIRKLYSQGDNSYLSIATMYDVVPSTIYKIVAGISYIQDDVGRG